VSSEIHDVNGPAEPSRLTVPDLSSRVAAWANVVHDLRYAIRLLRNSPGFSAVAIATIAIAIGANTAMFSFVNGVLLSPLPYPESDRIVRVLERHPNGGLNGISSLNYLDWTNQNTAFEYIAAEVGWRATLTGGDEPVSIRGARVSAHYFDIFGAKPALGRAFLPGEDQLGNDRVVLLSHVLWESRFGSDPAMVGRKILLDGEAHIVIGVLPKGPFDRAVAQIWKPLAFQPSNLTRDFRWLGASAKLKPGVTLEFFAALGDLDAVRTALGESGDDLATVNEAFVCACSFRHEAVASLLLERSIVLDPELGTHVDGRLGRAAFIKYFIDKRPAHATAVGPWKAFIMEQVKSAILDGDLNAFVRGLQRDPWLLGESYVWFQVELIGAAALNGREACVAALLDLEPALLRRRPPPASQAIEFAFTYANAQLIPLLTRVWPMPDDLPHAAGMGDLSRVKRWFDADGKPALGDLANHAPATSVHPRESQWGEVGVQQVLDTALAWSVINRHFNVADFFLEHGADISSNWNSHEPASILHHLVFLPNPYESMRFLVDRGIDMTIEDYRWHSTAGGWARYAAKDEKMAQWLEDAERQQGLKR
jgi:MacB-like periplasmic core domain